MPPIDSRYAIVAEKPASSSYGAVPVSNFLPTGVEPAVPSVREPEVRPAELVRRADQDVAAERLHVDMLVRGVVHRVEPGERAGFTGELGDALAVRDRSDRVRREHA